MGVRKKMVEKETKETLPQESSQEPQRVKPIAEREFVWVLTLLLFCYLLFFFQLGARPLWDGDEGMHATTSKEMVLSGDWITPTFNGEKFYDKPVFFNWLVSLSFSCFGFTEFAARLPAALLGTGMVMLVYLFGRALFSARIGFLGGILLATSGEHILLSTSVVHDIALAFFLTLSLFLFYMAYREERHRKRYLLLFYLSCGFSVLAKGPVGVVLPGLIIAVFLLIQGRLSFLKEFFNPLGIVLFAMIASPWYVLISLRNKDYLSYFLIHQNLMRFLSPKTIHDEPVYYYFPILIGGFIPWSCFLPVTLVRAFRDFFKERDERILFLLLWFLVIFLFFTAARSKLPTYILPLFPAISLLVAWVWNDLLSGAVPRLGRIFLYSLLPLFVALLVAFIFLWLDPPKGLFSEYGLSPGKLRVMMLWPLLGVGLSLLFLIRSHFKTALFSLAGMVVIVILFTHLVIVPAVNPYRSTKRLAHVIDTLLEPGEKIAFGRFLRESALFYTDRKALVLNNYKEVMDFFSSPRRVFAIVKKNTYEDLKGLREKAHVIDQEGNRLIISNRK